MIALASFILPLLISHLGDSGTTRYNKISPVIEHSIMANTPPPTQQRKVNDDLQEFPVSDQVGGQTQGGQPHGEWDHDGDPYEHGEPGASVLHGQNKGRDEASNTSRSSQKSGDGVAVDPKLTSTESP